MSFKLQSKIPQLTSALEKKAAALVAKTAFGIQQHIRESMAEEKHGREYGNHVASAPGESPAVDTSLLTNSIGVQAEGLTAYVGANAEYAQHLEFGTVNIAPRPFMEPAFEAAKPEFEDGLRELLR